ncbi:MULTISPECIES: MerR family transcriptional regulator [Cellulosimicrobium]|uniref:MerR family transcriptional regulator n=1 Tax=Cellulosimicrobium TaxID=157920 RepID=UPI001BAD4B4D|nr:MerR family transcriptional regulator [Cellulosimicrobium cellulans]QUC01957.1 MerR family transcriptional regulator [Cellulosimicrobium cellulans]
MGLNHKQIGEVAERTGLSLRTIRYYEEVGLITPSARSHGGFRLYTESDIARLMLVKRMKPLDFSLEEMRDLLSVLDDLERDDVEASVREAGLDRLSMYETAAEERCASLRTQLETAQEFAGSLRREVRRQRQVVSRSR